MANPETALLEPDARSGWVRLRTLIVLRWLAIAGQSAAILLAAFWLEFRIDLGLCFLAIGASVISNLIAIFVYPAATRLGEREVTLTLLFDISQLAFLLYLTGGLNNPFALLMLGPVTVAATTLGLGRTLLLGAVAMLLLSALALWHVPLRNAEGLELRLPRLHLTGVWLALMIGIVFVGAYARRVTREMHALARALAAAQMALAREHNLTSLGGVVAAAAHELGTPLATIKLTSAELADELDDRPDLKRDAELIREQADRCRDILRGMGRAGKDDLHLRRAPLGAVLEEAAEPHSGRGIVIHYDLAAEPGAAVAQPQIRRRPEVIHGLRNLVQNAVDFARTQVWVDARWSGERIVVRIADDGPGYPPDLIGRIGDPFLRRRRDGADRALRPEYEGMGLGLFIAKTLLERSGAEVSFANAADAGGGRSGAIVEVVWPLRALALDAAAQAAPLGQNTPIRG